MKRLAAALARRRVSPNHISLMSMGAATVTGLALAGTAWSDADLVVRGLYVLGAATIQLRLLCNLIDGMVAIEGGMRSPVGELYNEAPDRYSDAVTLIGAGYAVSSSPTWGYLAALLAVLTAYVRALGKAAGAGNDFSGPMAKPHRMATMTFTCVLLALLPREYRSYEGIGVMMVALVVIAAGSALTSVRRLGRAGRYLRKAAEWKAP